MKELLLSLAHLSYHPAEACVFWQRVWIHVLFSQSVSPSHHSDRLRRCAVDSQAWTCHQPPPNLIHMQALTCTQNHTQGHTQMHAHTHSYQCCEIWCNTQYSKYNRRHLQTHSWMLSIHKARSRGMRENSAVTTNHWQAKFITQPHRLTDGN